jgi:hypothetical protein
MKSRLIAGASSGLVTSERMTHVVTSFEHLAEFQAQISESAPLLRPYLTVNHTFILGKLRQLLFPFLIRNWNRDSLSDQSGSPIHSPNHADLYIPVVFGFIFHFFTLIFLAVNDLFKMTTFSAYFFAWMFAIVGEVVLTKMVFFAVNIRPPYPVLTLIADLGSISVYLTFSTVFCWNSTFRLVALVYVGICSFVWTLRTLTPKIGVQPVHPVPSQIYSLLGIAFVHAILPFFLVLAVPQAQTIVKFDSAKFNLDAVQFSK